MNYTPEQLREWAHHTHAAWQAAGEAVILDVDFITQQFRAHAATLEELQIAEAALRRLATERGDLAWRIIALKAIAQMEGLDE